MELLEATPEEVEVITLTPVQIEAARAEQEHKDLKVEFAGAGRQWLKLVPNA